MDTKTAKPNFRESCAIFAKALKISLNMKTVPSMIFSLIGIPMALLPMLISVTLRRFSNDIQALSTGNAVVTRVLSVFVALAAFYIIQLIFQTIQSYYTQTDTMRITRYVKERILRCTCDVKYKYIENYDDFKDKISFINTDAGSRMAGSMQGIITWFQSVITFVSIIIVLAGVDIWIVAILCAACVPAVILAYFNKDEEYHSKTLWIHEWNMACSHFFESVRQTSIHDVSFLGLYPYLREKWRVMNNQYIRAKNKMVRKHVLFNSIADMLRSGVYVFIMLITARRIFEDPELGIGMFMLVFTMAGQMQKVTVQLLVPIVQFGSDIAYMRDFFYLDEFEYETRSANAKPLEKFEIEFQNVCFSYPNTDIEVLHDVSVRIREGEKIAIVGENGSGKTTFVGLLCALHEPDSGSITMGGCDIFENLSCARSTLSAVFQEFARYESSIRENITVSDSKRRASDEEWQQLTRSIGAAEFIAEQADGLDSIVGSFSATGNNLSGGQWQKIALSRCLYRDKARIIVLDEPTAALDPLAEAELYRNFASLTGDRTTILISHRLGIASLVDRILVFDEGRIVEDGNHNELLARNGLYAKMYRAQAQWYR